MRTVAILSALVPLFAPLAFGQTDTRPLDVCNRSSYAVDVAIGIEVATGAATQGWFRVLPGDCTEVLKEGLDAKRHHLHVRPLDLYGAPPTAETGALRLCVRDADFVIAGATECSRDGQFMTEFVAIEPTIVNDRRQAAIDEPGQYDEASARIAALQRLLGLAGYDAGTIDGLRGSRTDAAIGAFARTAKLSASDETAILAALIEQIATGQAEAVPKFCNETLGPIMLAVGTPVGARIETRGWFRISPGNCARPISATMAGRTIYAFAEAVDNAGAALMSNGTPIAWRGDTPLCTKNLEFTIRDQEVCESRGLKTHDFKAYVVPDKGTLIVPFEPMEN